MDLDEHPDFCSYHYVDGCGFTMVNTKCLFISSSQSGFSPDELTLPSCVGGICQAPSILILSVLALVPFISAECSKHSKGITGWLAKAFDLNGGNDAAQRFQNQTDCNLFE